MDKELRIKYYKIRYAKYIDMGEITTSNIITLDLGFGINNMHTTDLGFSNIFYENIIKQVCYFKLSKIDDIRKNRD